MTRSRALVTLLTIGGLVGAGLVFDIQIGPDETRAAKDRPARGSWFVSPTGTDTEASGQGTHPSKPWRTISYALNTTTLPVAGDTFFCMTGTWVSPDAPSETAMRSALQGDEDFPTVISSYRGGTPVFDGTGYEGVDKGAFFLQNKGGVRFIGLTFLNYFDEDTTNNTSRGIIWQTNQTAAVDTFLGVDVLSCTFTCDDRGSMGTLGRSRTAIRFQSNDGVDPATDVIWRPFIENNIIERTGDHAIILAWNPYAAIQSNWISSELKFNVNQPDGPEGIVALLPTEGVTVSRNDISQFDHGISVQGYSWIIRENWVHDLNDDGIFIRSNVSRDMLVEQNLIWRTGDEGIDIQGKNGVCRRNTFWRWSDSGIGFTGGSGTSDWEIYDNVFVDACVCNPDETPGAPRYVNIFSDIGANLNFNWNVYYDPQGAFFDDSRPGGPGTGATFAQWQAAGNDPNSFEQSPIFGDTLSTPPNLTVSRAGPAVANSRSGGTIGGQPCTECLWWAVSTTTGIDSVRVITVDKNRSIQSAAWNDGVFKFGNTFVFDDPIPTTQDTTYIQLAAHWTLQTNAKDSPQTAEDTQLIPPEASADIDYTTLADTVWNPTSAAYRWRNIHSADSVAWNQGSGAFLGDIVTRDAGTLGRVPYASVRVFADPARLLAIGNLTTALNGTRGYAYEPNQTYYFTGWAKGYQTTDAQYKPQSDGFVFNIDLNTIDVPITTDPELCTVTVQTIDFQGIAVDSILVEATFEGSGANTGDLILSYSSVSCITDAGGFCGVDLVRSVEIDTPDRIDTYTFTMTDQRVPTTFAPITFRRITVPDQASANLGDLVP